MFKSVGWTWNPLYGCTHNCPYKCYARRIVEEMWKKSFSPPTFRPHFLNDVFPSDGSWIFVCSMGDLFCDGVDRSTILQILSKIESYEGSCKFLLQTKNPRRFYSGPIRVILDLIKEKTILGTTFETDELIGGGAPTPFERYRSLHAMASAGFDTFLSLEPFADCDIMEIQGWIWDIRPEAIEIGRENYGSFLKPASDRQIKDLIEYLRLMGIPYILKDNVKHLELSK